MWGSSMWALYWWTSLRRCPMRDASDAGHLGFGVYVAEAGSLLEPGIEFGADEVDLQLRGDEDRQGVVGDETRGLRSRGGSVGLGQLTAGPSRIDLSSTVLLSGPTGAGV